MIKAQDLPDPKKLTLIERQQAWIVLILGLMVEDEQLRESVPSEVTIFVLPSNDPELCDYNMQLADRQPEGTEMVMIAIEMQQAQTLALRPLRPTAPALTYSYA